MKWWPKNPVAEIKGHLQEKRALPTGVKEFHEWADRIIGGSAISATPESQKFVLAREILDLPRTMALETDLYFINLLRKYAANQVADAMAVEIRNAVKSRLAQEEEDKKQKLAAVTAPQGDDGQVLADSGV